MDDRLEQRGYQSDIKGFDLSHEEINWLTQQEDEKELVLEWLESH